MRRSLIAGVAALLTMPVAAHAAPATVRVTRLSPDISGQLASGQSGVPVTVALERDHRDAQGRLLDQHAVSSLTVSSTGPGNWSVRLERPWGDPRDLVRVTSGGSDTEIVVAGLDKEGAVVPGLAPSSLAWADDEAHVTVDCGDSGAHNPGACTAVGVTNPAMIGGVQRPGSQRLWDVTFPAPVSLDDHVLLTETRTIKDSVGGDVNLVVSRDAGMPRGGDSSVVSVAGVAPRCAAELGARRLRCYDLRAGQGYVAQRGDDPPMGLTFDPVTTAFVGDVPGLSGGSTVTVTRVGATSPATVLHVARLTGDGAGAPCDPGAWLGVATAPPDLRSTMVCPADGRMTAADHGATEMDEQSGGWTELTGPPVVPPPSPYVVVEGVTARSSPPGHATLGSIMGPRTCLSTTNRVRQRFSVLGRNLLAVGFFLDDRPIARVFRADRAGRYAVRLSAAMLKGMGRQLRAVAVPRSGYVLKPRERTRAVRRCSKHPVSRTVKHRPAARPASSSAS